MESRRIAAILLALFFLVGYGAAQAECSCIGEHDVIEVNGQVLHYAAAGEGKPVVLLHGNGGSHEHMNLVMAQLVDAGYRVYALDSRGQGANDPVEVYHYADMAEDTYQFIRALGLEKPAVYGMSDGGIIALEMALAYPGCASVLAISGANLSPEGVPGLLVDDDGEITPLERLVMTEPHIDPQELAAIDIPVLVTAAEYDFVLEAHTRLIAESLPYAQLYLLEGESHSSYVYENTTMGDLLARFLKDCRY